MNTKPKFFAQLNQNPKRTVLLLLCLFALLMVFNFLIFPWLTARVDPTATFTLLDVKFGFSHQQVGDMFEFIGKEGREAYLIISAVADMIYPFVYGGFLAVLIGLLISYQYKGLGKFSALFWLPLFPMVFDFLENFGILVLLKQFPDVSRFFVSFASLVGMLKWIGVYICFAIVLVLLVRFLVLKLRESRFFLKQKTE